MSRALVTGGSEGLGRALAAGLVDAGWEVVITGRRADALHAAAQELGDRCTAVVGDVTDPHHRERLGALVAPGLDLLVNNASTLGPTPLRPVAELRDVDLRDVWETNVVAPTALVRAVLPALTPRASIVAITSDAAVEHYETWGAYAASKAALEHLTLTLAAELPRFRWWAVDPGDLRTRMHQDAFPGEDVSDRPLPETVVPAFLRLVEERPPSGRLRAADLLAGVSA